MKRCSWATSEPEASYHDNEWGKLVTEDNTLFEFLTLEGAQAGLSWKTILNKREGYQTVFYNFDIKRVAAMDEDEIQQALSNPEIVRHEGKIRSTIQNAQVIMNIQQEFGSFYEYIWSHFPNGPKKIIRQSVEDFPAQTIKSKELSKDLKKRGCNFVGPTIMYSFMQAVGVVDEHEKTCFRA